jgi:glutaredoxin
MKAEIYTSKNCPHCGTAKEFLKKKGLEIEEINIDKDDKTFEEFKKKFNVLMVPVIVIGDNTIFGFNKEKIEETIQNG